MKKQAWKNRIRRSCQAAETYRPYFDDVIDTLAGILERRDKAQEAFDAAGGEVIVEHTNKGGATNYEQNPALRLINDLERDALTYWRDLGLTPAGLKRINEEGLQKKKGNALAEALRDLG